MGIAAMITATNVMEDGESKTMAPSDAATPAELTRMEELGGDRLLHATTTTETKRMEELGGDRLLDATMTTETQRMKELGGDQLLRATMTTETHVVHVTMEADSQPDRVVVAPAPEPEAKSEPAAPP